MARRKPRGPESQLAFEAIAIEGGLLSADWLARVAQQKAGGQSDAEYRVPKGINLRDDIGRYWRIAQAHAGDFAKGRAASADARALSEQFVHALLRDCFGFTSLAKVSPTVIKDRTYPVGAMAVGTRVPVVVAPAGEGLDALTSAFGDGARKRSAFGLAQECLNASDDAMWGLASDGLTLRILRDNASLTRPAWIEADLGRIFAEERFADFAALWLLLHETRFGAKDRAPQECSLEEWRNAGREEGTRAREDLRKGVEDALLSLGNGFLAHADNGALRSALESGALKKEGFFQELLRLVYRIIFLLTAEERSVLHDPSTTEAALSLYAAGYGMRRLRDRSARRNAYDRFGDLWVALAIVLRGLSRGEARLGLPALGGLFDTHQCPTLDAAKLENRALLFAIFRLSWLRDDGNLTRVNWRDMGPEELGSVYESLLELVPQVTDGARKLTFATGAETKGNARKTTGSYYTPDSLVQVLLDSALEPVIEDTIAKNPGRASEALLNLSIVDPACGSGHFLLSAARRLAAHVARIDANGTPSGDQYRHALRQVVGRCIFGVDLNPMAVELCKVSLWMEAVEPGRPLSFLDSHIQHGNALLGATPELLANGIPDAAWDPLEGDEKKIASALKKQNKKERAELSLSLAPPPASTYARIGAGARSVDDCNDESLDAIEKKESEWRDLVSSAAYAHEQFVADLWCASFVWRKEASALRELAPTESTFRAAQKDGARSSRALREEVERLRKQYAFLHWHLAFPQVFAKGGFELVLGNPPWEKLQVEEKQFFEHRQPEIARARASERRRLLDDLSESNPRLWAQWIDANRLSSGEVHFLKGSGRYPLCGTGNLNTYALFVECCRAVLAGVGRSGLIVPSGIITNESNKEIFFELMRSGELAAAFDFENREGVFPAVHSSFRFAVMTMLGHAHRGDRTDFVFFASSAAELAEPSRHLRLTSEDLALVNPNTRTCPTFRSQRDMDLVLEIHRRVPVLEREGTRDNTWLVESRQMLNATHDSDSFRTDEQLAAEGVVPTEDGCLQSRDGRRYLRLLEGKMAGGYNHRQSSVAYNADVGFRNTRVVDAGLAELGNAAFFVRPQFWVAEERVIKAVPDWYKSRWFVAYKRITSATNERTLIGAVVPWCGANDTLPVLYVSGVYSQSAFLLANMNSFVLDFVARTKVGGLHVNHFVLKQLPFSPVTRKDEVVATWCSPEFVVPRVLELTFTAWDLESFARDLGYHGPPFRWDAERRFLLRCELDAGFFHIYGLSRADTDYVMDSFPIVRKNDERAHGEYRTKRVILEIYDAMAEAARNGKPYLTLLDPPPADPRVAHPPRDESKLSSRSRTAE